MTGLETNLAPAPVYLAFFFIFGSYILTYKLTAAPQRYVPINIIMIAAFIVSAFLILLDSIVAIVQSLLNGSLSNSLSNYDVFRLSLIILLYFLMLSAGLIVNHRQNRQEPPESAEPPNPDESEPSAAPAESEPDDSPESDEPDK